MDNDSDAREELIIHYSYIVQSIVRRIMPKYNNYNEFEDFISTGLVGLIDAIERFEPERGFIFETYATSRVRGEIIDYMRAQDWASPSMRQRISQITRKFEELESKNGTPAGDYDVAILLNLTLDQVRDALRYAHIFNIMSLESMLNENGFIYEIPENDSNTPENILLNKDFSIQLAKLIENLPERERLIITLYYYEGFLLKDIAYILKITEGRVSQIHSKILEKLKRQLAE